MYTEPLRSPRLRSFLVRGAHIYPCCRESHLQSPTPLRRKRRMSPWRRNTVRPTSTSRGTISTALSPVF